MSYRNPQQYVDTTTAKSFQNLQQTIAGSFAGRRRSSCRRADRILLLDQEHQDSEN